MFIFSKRNTKGLWTGIRGGSFGGTRRGWAGHVMMITVGVYTMGRRKNTQGIKRHSFYIYKFSAC